MTSDLRTLYLFTLAEMVTIERSIISHLPDLIEAATNTELRAALKTHLEESTIHHQSLVHLVGRPTALDDGDTTDHASFEILMSETLTMLETLTQAATIDSFIIAAALTVEHIEIAKYQNLITWSKALQDNQHQDMLVEIYKNEIKTAELLTSIGAGTFFTKGITEDAIEKDSL